MAGLGWTHMNRTIQILAWGIAGTVLTGALTGAAIVVTGNGIAAPVRPFNLTSEPLEQPDLEASEPHEGRGHDRGADGGGGSDQLGDNFGGDSASGSNSGPGSGSSAFGSDEGPLDPEGHHDGDGGDDDD